MRSVRQLYEEAVRYGLQDEPVDEVEYFIEAPKDRGVCGLCGHRKTDKCPYPHESRLCQPVCLEFKMRTLTNKE